ncbi:hypothetical protein CROQUDRAFT_76594 [Cronartium quercuum f. sp. fusiforme G11]|uniref:Heme haloperoxidase family profile domain-containing protein n=1 Tax=Cronartium quercuum f. sp. fusiforme G11 TaxID=708437 RepID=A0A9P6TE46_9BASI|nr:hypothetical protein CROQUDRAFT_76594 [Cronartium quercuum f. sp. fusiforme G11]
MSTSNQNEIPNLFILASKKLFTLIYHTITNLLILIAFHIADAILSFANLLTPAIGENQNVPKPFSPTHPPQFSQHPFIYLLCYLARFLGPERCPEWVKWWSVWNGIGEDGKWREVNLHQARNGSRGPCPGLNALSNHSIINSNGQGLAFHQITAAISRTYNVSPILAIRALYGANSLFEGRNLINLSDFSAHGMIEHDASLLRPDIDSKHSKSFKEIQARPDIGLINRFLPSSKLPLTLSDFSKALSIRRFECANLNPTFYTSFKFNLIGSENCAILYAITGGNRDVVRKLVGIDGYERFETNWRPAGKEAFGLTMVKAQALLAWIELGTTSSFRSKVRNV